MEQSFANWVEIASTSYPAPYASNFKSGSRVNFMTPEDVLPKLPQRQAQRYTRIIEAMRDSKEKKNGKDMKKW